MDAKSRSDNTALVPSPCFPCPVCGAMTIEEPAMWDICPVCGWEDDGFIQTDDDSGFGANGPFTRGGYREWYQKAKSLYPDADGFELNDRIMAALPANWPIDLDVGRGYVYLWNWKLN